MEVKFKKGQSVRITKRNGEIIDGIVPVSYTHLDVYKRQPHITEELWENLGFAAQTGKMCCQAEWPVADESKTVASTVEMAVQVNGKLKGTISMPTDSGEQAVVDAALAVEKVAKATEGMQIVKTILVKNRLVNLIVKPR